MVWLPPIWDIKFGDQILLRNAVAKFKATVPPPRKWFLNSPSNTWRVYHVKLTRVPNATMEQIEVGLDTVVSTIEGAIMGPSVFHHRPNPAFDADFGVDEFIVGFHLSESLPDLSSYGPRITTQQIWMGLLDKPIAKSRRRGTAKKVIHGSGHNRNYGTIGYSNLSAGDKRKLLPFCRSGIAAYVVDLEVDIDNFHQLQADMMGLKRMIDAYASINNVKFDSDITNKPHFLLVFPAGEELLDWGRYRNRMTSCRVTYGWYDVGFSADVVQVNKALRDTKIATAPGNNVDSETEDEKKQEGNFYPGKGFFDSATLQGKLMRYQKKTDEPARAHPTDKHYSK